MTSSGEMDTKKASAQLLQRRKVVLAEIRTHLHSSNDPALLAMVDHLNDSGDWLDADALNDADVAILNNELLELVEIDAALLRIKAGNYGVCIDCGEVISAERMQVLPTAQRCIACQAAAEKKHAHGHGALL